jgi:hypothetical protein
MVVADRALWWTRFLATPRGPGVLLSASHPRPMAELGVTGHPAGERAAIFVARRDPVDFWGDHFPALCVGLVAWGPGWLVKWNECYSQFPVFGSRNGLRSWGEDLGGGWEACQLKRGRREVEKRCLVGLAQLVAIGQEMQRFGDAMPSKIYRKSSIVTISSSSVVLPLKSIEGEGEETVIHYRYHDCYRYRYRYRYQMSLLSLSLPASIEFPE